MLKLENINVSYDGKNIIRNVSFEVAKGELVCLLGPSGCGKTTTLRTIAGFERPETGIIKIGDNIISSATKSVSPQKRKIGFLFQDYALFPHLTVLENISYGLTGYNKKEAKNKILELLIQIRMRSFANRYPNELSGGEQQRVALARALAPSPKLLLLDEPFSGIDANLRTKLRRETKTIIKDKGFTSIMVTHDPEEAMLMADKIILMKEGIIVQTGTPEELYNKPINSFAAEFFGEVNYLNGSAKGNWIDTEAGAIPNKGFPEGTKLEVLIRPESIKLEQSAFNEGSFREARVCDIDYSGRSSQLRLGLGNGPEHRTHIKVQQPGSFKGNIGTRLHLNIDGEQVFTFPKQKN